MIRLVSIQTLKNDYAFDDNIEDKYLISNIDKCQAFVIKPLLGEDLYQMYLDHFDNDTLTEEERTVIEIYLEPIIAYFVMSECIFNTAYKLKNQGLESGDSYRFNELVKLSEKYKNDCDQYQEIFKKYACEEGVSIYSEKDTRQNIGLYLGNNYNIYNGFNLPNKK